jgi:uncharacterized membrane protein YeaQ/YmgE (transglycosylase-associated protein family)
MDEVLPLLAGLLVGVLAHQLRSPRQRVIAIVLASVVIGVVAALISGELAVSWAFAVFDIGQVLLAALIAMVVYGRVSRRAS